MHHMTLAFSLFTSILLSNNDAGMPFTGSIKVMQTSYRYGETLSIKANGLLHSDGSCGSAISWGLEQKKESGSWVVIKPIPTVVMACGVGKRRFRNEICNLMRLEPGGSLDQIRIVGYPLLKPGKYRVIAKNARTQTVLRTKGFSVAKGRSN